MESSSQDKNLPATAHRLKKAREDGQVPRSRDLSNLAVLGGGAMLAMGGTEESAMGGGMMMGLGIAAVVVWFGNTAALSAWADTLNTGLKIGGQTLRPSALLWALLVLSLQASRPRSPRLARSDRQQTPSVLSGQKRGGRAGGRSHAGG